MPLKIRSTIYFVFSCHSEIDESILKSIGNELPYCIVFILYLRGFTTKSPILSKKDAAMYFLMLTFDINVMILAWFLPISDKRLNEKAIYVRFESNLNSELKY